jgi:hypothetical protein
MPRKTLKQRKEKNQGIIYNSKNRIAPILNPLIGIEDPDDLMLEIMDALKDEVTPVPDIGKFYTFIYSPKTSNIQYDAHPLVAVTGVFQWGFRGINYHWGRVRQYTWNEVIGNLYTVRSIELNDLRTLPYGKFQISR